MVPTLIRPVSQGKIGTVERAVQMCRGSVIFCSEFQERPEVQRELLLLLISLPGDLGCNQVVQCVDLAGLPGSAEEVQGTGENSGFF